MVATAVADATPQSFSLNKSGLVAQKGYICAMSDTVVRARVDPALKTDAEAVFEQLGLTTTDAIRLFLSQVRLRKGLPFPVSVPTDNDDLLVSRESRQAALDSVYDD